jgi:hypothetical protein
LEADRVEVVLRDRVGAPDDVLDVVALAVDVAAGQAIRPA